MITDKIMQFLASVLTNVVDLLPDSSTTVTNAGQTANSPVAYLLDQLDTLVAGTNGGTLVGILNKTPLPLILDFGLLTFIIGTGLAIGAAFWTLHILLFLWHQIKW